MVSGEDLADCSGNLPEIVLRFCIFMFRCLIEFWLFVVSGDESHLPQAPRVGNHGLANEEAWTQIIHHCSRWFPRLFESKEWWKNTMLWWLRWAGADVHLSLCWRGPMAFSVTAGKKCHLIAGLPPWKVTLANASLEIEQSKKARGVSWWASWSSISSIITIIHRHNHPSSVTVIHHHNHPSSIHRALTDPAVPGLPGAVGRWLFNKAFVQHCPALPGGVGLRLFEKQAGLFQPNICPERPGLAGMQGR